MKLRNIFFILIAGLALSSCGGRVNNPEELTVPILQAIQAHDVDKIQDMLPPKSDVNTVFAANTGEVGYCYYNKYTKDYREKELLGTARTNYDVIKTISEEDGLDWDKVEYSAPVRKDVSTENTSYSIITTDLKFPGDKEYIMTYKAVNADNQWFLLDDIYFTIKPQPEQ